MRAAIVTPGKPESMRVADLPDPESRDGEALVRTVTVGLDATDREVAEGYGEPPPGDDFIVVAHEAAEVVERSPDPRLEEGTLVAPIVRRPDPVPCANCAAGEWDFCTNGRYTERGIKGAHGFASERFAEAPAFLVPVSETLRDVAVLVEPLSIVAKGLEQVRRVQDRMRWEPRAAAVLGAGPIGLLAVLSLRLWGIDVAVYDRSDAGPKRAVPEAAGATFVRAEDDGPLADALPFEPDVIVEATGYSPLALEAVHALAPNGVAVLTGVSSGSRIIKVDAACLNLEMVLENKVLVGTVNANRRHFEAAVRDLAAVEERWPGLAARFITRRLPLERFAAGLDKEAGDVKVVVDMKAERG